MSGPSNLSNFTTNSYNMPTKNASFCVKPGSMYTNKYANFNYFNIYTPNRPSSKQCGDPYTYYSYWYRRFPSQTKYLNCHYLPEKSVWFKNTYGYTDPGNNCNHIPRVRFNINDNGFKFYDTYINQTDNAVLNIK